MTTGRRTLSVCLVIGAVGVVNPTRLPAWQAVDLSGLLASVNAPRGTADSLRAGHAVAFLLRGRPSDEVALFAAVPVATTALTFLSRFGNLGVYQRHTAVVAAGPISDPPRSADFDSLAVPPTDLTALSACRVTSCAVKLPAAVIDSTRAVSGQAATSVIKAMFLDMSQQFLTGGIEALPAYGDKPIPMTPATALDSLLSGPTPILSIFTDLQNELAVENTPFGDAELFWLLESFGLRDVMELNAMTSRATGRPDLPAVVLTQRLYSSHYFVAGYSVTALLIDPSSPGTQGTPYLLYSARYRLDTSLNFLERSQLSGKLHSYATALVTGEKAGLEAN
jgi:hypothetical protein